MDLESITAVNNGLIDYSGVLLFLSCHDHQFNDTVANRVIEITRIPSMTSYAPLMSTLEYNKEERLAS